MQSFKFFSGRVSVGRIAPCGIFEVTYTGGMTEKAFDALRFEALNAARSATAFVVRLDGTLFRPEDGPDVDAESYGQDVAPGALIVRLDQYAGFVAYAAKAARFGVMRSVWLETNAEKAYEWAIRQALAAQKE